VGGPSSKFIARLRASKGQIQNLSRGCARQAAWAMRATIQSVDAARTISRAAARVAL